MGRAGCEPVISSVSSECRSDTFGQLCRTSGVARRLAASPGPVLLGQGKTQIAEPGTGDPDPLPAVRGLGSRGDVGQSGVQLSQFEAPLGSGVEVSASGGFVEEPFGFAVVIWTVHSVLFGRHPGVPGQGQSLTLT